MDFDWILFLSISILGPGLGSMLCAEMEKRVTGEVRRELEFKKKRIKSTFFSIALGYVITLQIIRQLKTIMLLESDIAIRLISIIIGVIVYLLFQIISYRFMLRNY